jgi:hypothetical protein
MQEIDNQTPREICKRLVRGSADRVLAIGPLL